MFHELSMKKYNFDEIIPRRNTGSYKWDSSVDSDILPMWVADMDFQTSPAIIDSLRKRVDHGIFGYTNVPEVYYRAVIDWFFQRHGWTINREWIIYTSGVVPALSAVIKALTTPGDRVLVQTPVYNCFFSSIRNNGCEVVECSLCYAKATYHIDFDDLEQKASDSRVKLMLLCNPHNPTGRVWSREELTQIGKICLCHGVIVVADEIHCDLVMPGHSYTPFASISEDFQQHSVTCISPSKAFNLAGLQIANIVTSDTNIRQRIDRAININEVCDVNPFGVTALIAAYNEGDEWLGELNKYLSDNYNYLKGFFTEHLHTLSVAKLEGTYLVWVDCRTLHLNSDYITQRLLIETGLMVNAGTMYGAAGEGFIRINIACPRQTLTIGLERLFVFYNNQTH